MNPPEWLFRAVESIRKLCGDLLYSERSSGLVRDAWKRIPLPKCRIIRHDSRHGVRRL